MFKTFYYRYQMNPKVYLYNSAFIVLAPDRYFKIKN